MEPQSVGERLYEEIWDKHVIGDCYKTEMGKKSKETQKDTAVTHSSTAFVCVIFRICLSDIAYQIPAATSSLQAQAGP